MISRRTFAAAVSAIPLAMLAWIVGATPAAAAGIIPVEMGPTTVAVAPDGSFAYVTNAWSGSVSRIRSSDHTVTATIAVGANPMGMAISPDGAFAYVANAGDNTLTRVRTSDDRVTATIRVGDNPTGVAIAPDGTFAYVTNAWSGSVARIRTSDNALVATTAVGVGPQAVAFAPDGSLAYIANYGTDTISRLRTSDNAVAATFPVGAKPSGIAFTPDGSSAFVTIGASASVVRVRTSDNTVTATIGVGALPQGVAISRDGVLAYVVNSGDATVSRLRISNNSVAATFPVGASPTGVAFAPDAAFAYVANTGEGTVSLFDLPSAPQNLHAVTGDHWADVSFDPPASDGGSPISTYMYSIDDGVTWRSRDPAAATSPIRITDLANGRTYRIRLRAESAYGPGVASGALTVTLAAIPVGNNPQGVAIAVDGTFAYVANSGSGTVSRIRTSDDAITATVTVGSEPVDVAMAANGTFAYVTNEGSGTVSRISTSDNAVVATIPTCVSPRGVAISPDSTFAYLACHGTRTILRLRTSDNAVTATIPVTTGFPSAVAIAPNGAAALVTTWEPAGIEDAVLKLRAADNAVVDTIRVGSNPFGVAYSPDSTFAYVSNNGSSTVSRVRLSDDWVVATIPVGSGPQGLAFSPDGSVAYVANVSSGSVSWLRTWNDTLGGAIATGDEPFDVAIAPSGLFGYATNDNARSVTRFGMSTAPTAVTATRGDRLTSVTFTAPASSGGAAVGNYLYSIDDGATWTARTPAATSSPLVISGLRNGATYRVRLRALTGNGPGLMSNAVSVTPAAAPSAPTGLVASPGDEQASVAFLPPATDGGSAILNYQFSVDDGGTWTTRSPSSLASPLLITGMHNGISHRVRLRAVNAVGPGASSVAVDVTPGATVFVPADPVRILDTRTGGDPIRAGETRRISVAGLSATDPVVPEGAVAIAYNLTVVAPSTAGHLRVMPGDAATLTATSAINFRSGETIANGLTTKIDSSRRIKIYASSTSHVVLDIVGYYLPAGASAPGGGLFTAVRPVRAYDSDADRSGSLPARSDRVLNLAMTQGGAPLLPTGATAVAYNITVVRPEGTGHMRVMPGDAPLLLVSTINWSRPGDVVANGISVKVARDRSIRVFNGSGVPVHFLIDVVGYYSNSGAQFFPTDPARVFDSRTSAGGAGPIAPRAAGTRTASVAATQATRVEQVPSGALAIAYNATVSQTGSSGHLRLYPASSELVDSSILNWPAEGYTRANGSVTAISPGRQVKIYNGSTSTAEVMLDTMGFFK